EGDRAQGGLPRQAVGGGDAGLLGDVAEVVGVVEPGDDDRDAGLVEQGGVVEPGAEGVEADRQVARGLQHDRDPGGGELGGDLPGLGAADDDEPQLVVAGEVEGGEDVAGAVGREGQRDLAGERGLQRLQVERVGGEGPRLGPLVGVLAGAIDRGVGEDLAQLGERGRARAAVAAPEAAVDGDAGLDEGAAVVAVHEVDPRDLPGQQPARGGDGGGGDPGYRLDLDQARVGVEGLAGVVGGAHRVVGDPGVVAGAALEVDLDEAEQGVDGDEPRG